MQEKPKKPEVPMREWFWCPRKEYRMTEEVCHKYWTRTCGVIYKCKRWLNRKRKEVRKNATDNKSNA